MVLFIFMFSMNSHAARKIADIDFENNTIDPYGYAKNTWYPVNPPEILQYVTGHTGMALRTSHNSDDGGGDLQIEFPFPDTNEVYIKWWVKYESDYWGNCGSIWNVKWLWTGTGTYVNHTENIFQGYSDGKIGFNSYQTEPNFRAFSSSGVPYKFGDWMKVEIYWKQSTGGGTNADGIFRQTVNDTVCINETKLVTGDIGNNIIKSPALKASCDCAAGKGWWQIDDFEVWDGMPDGSSDKSSEDFTPPAQPSGVTTTISQ